MSSSSLKYCRSRQYHAKYVTFHYPNGLWHSYRSTCKDKELKAAITWTHAPSPSLHPAAALKSMSNVVTVTFAFTSNPSLYYPIISVLHCGLVGVGHSAIALHCGWNWNWTTTVHVCGVWAQGHMCVPSTDFPPLRVVIKRNQKSSSSPASQLHCNVGVSPPPPRANDLMMIITDARAAWRQIHTDFWLSWETP